jgi:hypothetical protein
MTFFIVTAMETSNLNVFILHPIITYLLVPRFAAVNFARWRWLFSGLWCCLICLPPPTSFIYPEDGNSSFTRHNKYVAYYMISLPRDHFVTCYGEGPKSHGIESCLFTYPGPLLAAHTRFLRKAVRITSPAVRTMGRMETASPIWAENWRP